MISPLQVPTAQPALLWQYNNSGGGSVSISGDASYVVTSGGKDTQYVYFFDRALTGGSYVWRYFLGNGVQVASVAISRDGNFVAVGTLAAFSGVYLFDKTGVLLWNQTTDYDVGSIAISDDGSYIAARSVSYVYLFDKTHTGGNYLWRWGSDPGIAGISVSGDGSYVVSGSDDGYVYVFDRAFTGGTYLWRYFIGGGCPPYFIGVRSVSISEDGNYVVASNAFSSSNCGPSYLYFFGRSFVGSTYLWRYQDPLASSGPTQFVGVAVTSDGSYVAAVDDGYVYLFDKSFTGGSYLWRFGTGEEGLSVSVSDDGSYIAVGGCPYFAGPPCYDYLFDRGLTGGTYLWRYTGSEPGLVSISSDGISIAAQIGSDLYLFGFCSDSGGSFIARLESDSCLQTATTSSFTIPFVLLTYSFSLSFVFPNSDVDQTLFQGEMARLMDTAPTSNFGSFSYNFAIILHITESNFLSNLGNILHVSYLQNALGPDGEFYLPVIIGFSGDPVQAIGSAIQEALQLIKGAINLLNQNYADAKDNFANALQNIVDTLLSKFNMAVYYTSNDAFKYAASVGELVNNMLAQNILNAADWALQEGPKARVEKDLLSIGSSFALLVGTCASAAATLGATLLACFGAGLGLVHSVGDVIDLVITELGGTTPGFLTWLLDISDPSNSGIIPVVRSLNGTVILSPTVVSSSQGVMLYESNSTIAFLSVNGTQQYNMTLQGTGPLSTPFNSQISDSGNHTAVSSGYLNQSQSSGGVVLVQNGTQSLKSLSARINLNTNTTSPGYAVQAQVQVFDANGSLTNVSRLQIALNGVLYPAVVVSTGKYVATLNTTGLSGVYAITASAFKTGYFNGFASQPLNVAVSSSNSQIVSIQLLAGWNLISLPVAPNSTAITAAQLKYTAYQDFFTGPSNSVNNMFNKTGLAYVTSVYTYNGKTWLFCTVKSGSCGGTLTTMVDGSGYWVFTTSNTVVLSFGGWIIQPASAPVAYTLVKGWNLVGFKPQPMVQNEMVGQYLTSISGSYDQNNVWVYASTGWIRANSNYMLQPGQAMWILMTAPAALKP
jgi:hypothetical protein